MSPTATAPASRSGTAGWMPDPALLPAALEGRAATELVVMLALVCDTIASATVLVANVGVRLIELVTGDGIVSKSVAFILLVELVVVPAMVATAVAPERVKVVT